MFAKILTHLEIKKPGSNLASKTESRGLPIDSGSPDNQDLIRKLQDRVRDLEGKNNTLKDLVESLKSTFEFFELANDQYIMQKH
jgi:hypothetical protein